MQGIRFEIPVNRPEVLPVLPLRQGILFPGTASPFSVGRSRSLAALSAAKDGLLIVAAQREGVDAPNATDLLPIGVLARVVRPLGQKEGVKAVLIQGLVRVRIEEVTSTEPCFSARYSVVTSDWPDSSEGRAMKISLDEAVKHAAEKIAGDATAFKVAAELDPSSLVDLVASVLDVDIGWKHEILMTPDPLARAEKVLKKVAVTLEVLDAQKSIRDRVMSEVRDNERESILRRQLKAIQEELGEGGNDAELLRLKERLAKAKLTDEAREVVDRELARLSRIPQGGPERSVALDWLGWIADLPWQMYSAVDVDLGKLEDRLDETHYGLADVKRQVIEHLAVRKLGGQGRADVLLLVGPPGVGKTSIAQAIADATNRKLVRVALGGLRDEAELRGHRRTYIGSRPGRLIEGIRRAGTADAVVVLDEIDKLGRSWQGDPASALLEILDPEQNHAFVDHYLEVAFDLSKMLFVATANDLTEIPPPLRDRTEIIEIEGYTRDEKVKIARKHVLEKLAKNSGIELSDVVIDDEALEVAIGGWTREAGVRQLQRTLGKIFRKAAVLKAKGELKGPLKVTKDDVSGYLGRRRFFDEAHEAPTRAGIATGLAWTPLGGDVLYVEASTVHGKGKLVLTGQLGEVMKESAQAALTYVLSNADDLGIDPDVVAERDIHVHVPAGATPKDGPSAGVTMFTALASLLTGRPVRGEVAMTGEVTLRGRVLPVGGIKSKILAAHERGLKTIVVPKKNAADLEELPERVRSELEFVLADHVDDFLDRVLLPASPLTAPPTSRRANVPMSA
ncbi:MAG: endopeptidase La [Deltaproteobacteria bacterium]|nr:endopeptidase La [Deltaproteobacteria bacterium]